MSYSTWAHKMQEMNRETVGQYAPETFKAFTEILKKYSIDESDYAKYAEQGDSSYIGDFWEYEDEDVEMDDALVEVNEVFEKLKQEFNKNTGATLGLFAPSADIQEGESRLYFTIENYYVVNPNINQELLAKSTFAEVVMGG